MTGMAIGWLEAAAEIPTGSECEERASQQLPHTSQLGGRPQDTGAVPAEFPMPNPGRDPELWLYRDRTVALLRRYARLAVEVGRLPSLLGREFFRTRLTSYNTQTFEDAVIFVHDVERCLDLLDAAEKALIATIILEEHTQEEAARLLRCTHRTIARHYPEALDRVSEIFLKREILIWQIEKHPRPPETCQEGKKAEFPVSRSS